MFKRFRRSPTETPEPQASYQYQPLWKEFDLEPPVNTFDYELLMDVAEVTPSNNAALFALFERAIRESGLPLKSPPKLYITTLPLDAQALMVKDEAHVILNAHAAETFLPLQQGILQYFIGHELGEIYYCQKHRDQLLHAIEHDDLHFLRDKERLCDRIGLSVCDDIDAVIHYMNHPEHPIVDGLPDTHPRNEERHTTFREVRDATPHWRDILAIEAEKERAPNPWQQHLDRADQTRSANPRTIKLVDFIR